MVAAQPNGAGGDGRYLDHSAANTIAIPCNVPQRTKFQPAPCHRPQRVMVSTMAQKCCISPIPRDAALLRHRTNHDPLWPVARGGLEFCPLGHVTGYCGGVCSAVVEIPSV